MACITKRMILLPIVYFVLYVSLVYASDTDTLREGSAITGKATLISAAHKFELGFFTPDGASDKSTYLGIWYYGSNPKIVVWVANRDRPLPNSDASFAIMGANAMVLGPKNVSYWSTNSDSYSSSNYNTIVHLSSTAHRGKQQQQQQQPGPAMTPSSAAHRGNRWLRIVKLNDNGELVFTDRGGDPRPTIWRSFDHPTDTFLPGMKLDTNTNLTSWRAPNDPALGNYAFLLGQEGFQFMISHQVSPHYWESGSGTSNDMPTNMIKLLLGSTTGLALDTIRLVMRSNGTIQYLKQQKGTNKWSIMWWQPKDRCSLYNPCGVNGSCNGKNGRLCKCLPGFHPQTPEEWDSGHFSGGCTRKSDNCSDKDPMFLKLPMLRAGNPWDNRVDNEEECRKLCFEECCRAYSYDANGGSRQATCLIWSNDLLGVQEEYPQGYNLLLRVSPSDIESTSRDCKPCGTYIIPYPLSTSPSCGDLTYSHFHCNTSTGQLEFQAPGGRFRVTAIDPNATKFFIQTRNKNCDIANIQSHVLGLNNSFPFSATKCGDMDGSYLEVEMHWIPAPEPRCNSSRDCHSDWPDTTCKTATDDKNRCLCGGKLNWNSSELNCTSVYSHNEKVVKIGLASAAGVLLIVLLCGVVFIIYVPRRRAAAGSGYYEFREEDGEGIEVPFTNWESIVAATDNFSDANKLGAGGFGPVYKGQLSDGKEIAVKRLSSASGQGIVEFRNEVVLIAKLQHRNLVRLLGYCVWKHEKILLYEYMPNKSLDSFLFDHKLSAILDWEKRFNIILGIARGLLYLHQDSRLRIIHRDLKPNNILLDEELNPKISDFGLARIVAGKDEAANTCTIVGTYGYMSPEYALEGLFSVKSDVYSFGVMVLEIISGKRSTQTIQLEQAVLSLLGYAWRLWNEERAMELMEQEQRERSNRDEVIRCLNVGLLCVQEDPSDRPVMSSVVLMLCNEIMNLSPPKQPAFIERRRGSETTPSSSQLGSSTSCNMITVTSLEGR